VLPLSPATAALAMAPFVTAVPRTTRVGVERRTDRLHLDLESQLGAQARIGDGAPKEDGRARRRASDGDRRAAVALELPETGGRTRPGDAQREGSSLPRPAVASIQ